jgi:hypothetical protein
VIHPSSDTDQRFAAAVGFGNDANNVCTYLRANLRMKNANNNRQPNKMYANKTVILSTRKIISTRKVFFGFLTSLQISV